MRTFRPVMFKCKSCLQEANCGPHTSVTSYKIFKLRKQLHRDCFDPLRRFKTLSTVALAAYTKERKERPAMKYSIGWKYGYYRAFFSAYLITKHNGRISPLDEDLNVCLKKHQQKWEQNQKTKDPRNATPSTEYDGNIDGTICGLKEAIKLLERINPEPCIEVSIC